MNHLSLVRARKAFPELSLEEFANYFNYGGSAYGLGYTNQTYGAIGETMGTDFAGIVEGAYKRDGVVFACHVARMLLYTEARFQFRRRVLGRPGALFGTQDLAPLENPWPNGTTGDLLAKVLHDVDFAGNSLTALRPGNQLRRLRPDWTVIITGTNGDPEQLFEDIDFEVIGYAYIPGGLGSGNEEILLTAAEVAHFAPIPDPIMSFRGMSCLHPIVNEVLADRAATLHKLKFFENGGTTNMIVTLAEKDPDKFANWVKKFRDKHEGLGNAYKTLFFGMGADAKVVGADFRQMDFKRVQGGGETRIAAAFRVPAIIVGLSEGLEAATYANYGQARRAFADATMRPLWRGTAGAFSNIIRVPTGSELWYDDRDISFLQEDQKDAAFINEMDARSIRFLVDAGYEPDAVVDAIVGRDYSALRGHHTGLYSVQLQPPGNGLDTNPEGPDANGKTPPPAPASPGQRAAMLEYAHRALVERPPDPSREALTP